MLTISQEALDDWQPAVRGVDAEGVDGHWAASNGGHIHEVALLQEQVVGRCNLLSPVKALSLRCPN